ncbi:MAG: hypothetical protein ACLFUE_01320 [Desulfobacteraceae bacterium]
MDDLCRGKTDFDHVKGFLNDSFFRDSLGLKRVPSAEILRQHFQSMAMESPLFDRLPECSIALWKKAGMRPLLLRRDRGLFLEQRGPGPWHSGRGYDPGGGGKRF